MVKAKGLARHFCESYTCELSLFLHQFIMVGCFRVLYSPDQVPGISASHEARH